MSTQQKERFIITTTLEGYINALKPAGKFKNCAIGFKIPPKDLAEFDKRHEDCLAWAKEKFEGKRHEKALPKWEEDGTIKYNYGGPSTPENKNPRPMFPWIDSQGELLDPETQIRSGTVVRLIIDIKPYIFGNKGGSSIYIRGAQVIKLVTGAGSDSGSLDQDELTNLFGTVEDGFSVNDPQYEPHENEDDGFSGDDEDDVPF